MYIREKKEELQDGQSKIVTILIVILPLLRYYIPGLKPIMFSDVVQLFLVFIGITRKNHSHFENHVRVKNTLILYGAYVIFATVVSSFYMPVFDVSTNITTITRLWIYILIIYYTLDEYFDIDYGFKLALKIAIINSCLTFIQLLLFYIFGKRTSFLIPFLDAEAGYSNERVFDARLFRSTGLFYEPAQSVYYYIPLLFILLFSKSNNQNYKNNTITKNILYSIVLSIGLISTESGAAAIILIFVWGFFAIYYLKKSKNLKGLTLMIIIASVLFILFKLDFFAAAFNRGSNITKGSGSTRIIRGFLTWIQFPFEYKFFGIGYANYKVYVYNAGLSTIYDYVQDIGITNASIYILSGLGIFGVIILLMYFIRTFKCSINDLPSFLLIIYLFFSLFYSGIFLGIYFMIYMAYILSRTKTNGI